MKKRLIFLIAVMFFFAFLPEVFSADADRIGVIDFQRIVKESSAGKLTQKQLNDQGAEMKKQLETEKTQLEELKTSLERESLVLSPEKQKEKQRAFRIIVNDFKKMQKDFSQEFKRLEAGLLNKIQKAVFEIANEIGDKEGYLLIIEKKSAGVIYNPDKIDITDKVIKQYNLNISKIK